jgi:hypothetical protein
MKFPILRWETARRREGRAPAEGEGRHPVRYGARSEVDLVRVLADVAADLVAADLLDDDLLDDDLPIDDTIAACVQLSLSTRRPRPRPRSSPASSSTLTA